MSSGRLIHPALECVSCCLWYWHGTAEVRGPEFASEQGVGGGRNDGRGTVLRQCWLCREPCVRWRHRMLQGPGPKGGRDRWLWAIRNVTCLKCKAWSNDPFKVQADHTDWENYGTEGGKGWKGFLVILKVKGTQLHQKRTTPRWWLNPLPLETRGGDSFPHGGGFSPNSEWGHFYALDSYSCSKSQGE